MDPLDEMTGWDPGVHFHFFTVGEMGVAVVVLVLFLGALRILNDNVRREEIFVIWLFVIYELCEELSFFHTKNRPA